jgi:hypothetical protein
MYIVLIALQAIIHCATRINVLYLLLKGVLQ